MIRVALFGCGVMGTRIAQALLDRPSVKIAAAVDLNPALAGKDLGEVMGSKPLGVKIGPSLDVSSVDAVIHATTSRFEDVARQISPMIEAGLDVVSTCEELSYPWKRHPELSKRIDELAKRCNATVVGTGINPGYLMDTLPLTLTAPCLRVDRLHVTRMMNSSKRRIPFQKKIGTGMSVEEFRKKIDAGEITGHVGLLESIHMIAGGLGWTLDKAVELPPEPVVAQKETPSGMGPVAAGKVLGLKSEAYAERGGSRAITLTFIAHAEAPDEYDEILVEGEPNLRQRILGGVHGDTGTVAMVVNTLPLAVGAPPGLLTMKDLPVPRCAR